MQIPTMQALDLRDKRVMIRLDLNVPLKEGMVTSDARIMASIPTIQMALEKGAQVILTSHLGRPDPQNLYPCIGERSNLIQLCFYIFRNIQIIYKISN